MTQENQSQAGRHTCDHHQQGMRWLEGFMLRSLIWEELT